MIPFDVVTRHDGMLSNHFRALTNASGVKTSAIAEHTIRTGHNRNIDGIIFKFYLTVVLIYFPLLNVIFCYEWRLSDSGPRRLLSLAGYSYRTEAQIFLSGAFTSCYY